MSCLVSNRQTEIPNNLRELRVLVMRTYIRHAKKVWCGATIRNRIIFRESINQSSQSDSVEQNEFAGTVRTNRLQTYLRTNSTHHIFHSKSSREKAKREREGKERLDEREKRERVLVPYSRRTCLCTSDEMIGRERERERERDQRSDDSFAFFFVNIPKLDYLIRAAALFVCVKSENHGGRRSSERCGR